MQRMYVEVMADLGQPEGHAEAWDWLAERMHEYPGDRRYWPWKQAKRVDRWRPIAMVGATPAVLEDDSTAGIAALYLYRPPDCATVTADDPRGMARAAAEVLLSPANRRTSLVVVDGSAWLLESILANLVPTWVEDGYTITPLIGGHVIKGMVVRKGRERWTLSDLSAMTGSTADELLDGVAPDQVSPTLEEARLATLCRAVTRLQETTRATFGVYLRPTVAGTAMRAAGFDLPDGVMIPRPPPWVVTLCRSGGGFRGGYVFGQRYRGPAWKVDARRLYARALMEPLPTLWAFGPGVRDGVEVAGLFMCTVSGQALHPVTLPQWQGPEEGFSNRPYTGTTAIAVLPSTEYRGLRAMGLRVEPGFGWVGTHPMSLRGFIDRLQALIREHGTRSREGRLAKLLGNTLYGRMAVSPKRDLMQYGLRQPSGSSWPVVRLDGTIVDNLWAVEEERYSPGQQVGTAAMVTGWARSHLYEEMARRIREGATIVHAHTDGYVATGPVPADLPWDTDEIGAWRLEAVDDDAIVARAAGYVVGAETRWSGTPHEGRRTIELAWTQRGWLLQGQQVVSLGRS